jgi:hypothetical protein
MMGYPEEEKAEHPSSEPLLQHPSDGFVQPGTSTYRLGWILSFTFAFSLAVAILAFMLGFQKGQHFAQLPDVLTPIPKCEYTSATLYQILSRWAS